MTIYLYKKTHNITGLKYLGKTTQDPYKYKGSGIRWLPHIKKHGYDVTTEILKECATNEEVFEWGKYYSDLWDVVTDPSWANLKPEYGEGGSGPQSETTKKKRSDTLKARGGNGLEKHSDASKELMASKKLGRKQSQDTCNKRSASLMGRPSPMKGRTQSPEARSRIKEAALLREESKRIKRLSLGQSS